MHQRRDAHQEHPAQTPPINQDSGVGFNFTHGDAEREGPVDAGGAYLERRRLADPTRELRVPVRSTATGLLQLT